MFNRELWKLASLGVTVVFPPVPHIQSEMTNENFTDIFRSLTRSFDYSNLSFQPGGAKIESENKSRIMILKDRIQLEERISVYYGESSRKFSEILGEITEKLKIQMLVLQINRLNATWDIGGSAVNFIMDQMLRMTMERMKLLCPERMGGVGLKFLGHDPVKGERHDVTIEPDPSSPNVMRFIVDHHFMKPLTGMETVRERIDESYNLSRERIQQFVESFNEEDKSFD